MGILRDDDEDADLIHYIAETQGYRRELLWLRAQERGDALTAGLLEREDPELHERMQRWASVIGVELAIDDRIQRARTYHALWGRRFELIRCLWVAERNRAKAAT